MTTMISRDDVLHLAELSHLQLEEEEISALKQDIERILDYVDELSNLDTSNTEPTYQVNDRENVMREDVVQSHTANRDALLELAPEAAESQIKVPRVL